MARTKQTVADGGGGAQKAPRQQRGGKATPLVPPKSIRKPHKWRAGTVAVREIKRYQNSTEHLIPRAPFKRLVREVIHSFNDTFRVQGATIEALLEASEAYLVEHFERTQTAAVHAKRITIYPKDSRLVTNLAKSLGVSTYMDQMLTDQDIGKRPFGRTPRVSPAVAAAAAAGKKPAAKKKKAAAAAAAAAAASGKKKASMIAVAAAAEEEEEEDGEPEAAEPAEAEGAEAQEFDDAG